MAGSSKTLFVREATGLVRNLSFLDQFLISQGITGWYSGVILVGLFAPFYFPGANLPIVFAIGAIPAFAMALVYSKLSAGMPRSGGDYVWSSRILGPFYATVQLVFLFVGTVIIGVGLSVFASITIALSAMMFALGVTTNNGGMITTATALTQPGLGFPISIVIVAFVTVVALLGLRVYSWFQRIIYVFVYFVTALFAVLLLTLDFSQVPSLFNHAMQVAGSQATYQGIIREAASGGFSPGALNISNTLLAAIPWGFLTFTGFNFGTYLSGETKNVKSSMFRALFLSVAVSAIGLVSLATLVYNDFGVTFMNAASYVAANNPSELPALPTSGLLLSLVNPVLAVVLNLGLFLGWMVVCVAYTITMARMLFAGAFDRLLPEKFSAVDERFHTPQWATLFCGVCSAIYLTVYWNAGWAATYLNTSMVAPIAYLLPLLAALVFPFMKRDLFKRTVGPIGSTTSIVIGSAVGVAAFGFYIIAETFPIASGVFLGANLLIAYAVVAVLILIGAGVYAAANFKAKQVGLDLKKAYTELPPE